MSGWCVTLRWYADSTHPRPEFVSPYPTHMQAVAAMQDSLLVDVYVDPDPASIARMCADYRSRVTLIDPGDPSHFGGPDPEPTVTARSGRLQTGALHIPGSDESRPATGEVTEQADRSPSSPGR